MVLRCFLACVLLVLCATALRAKNNEEPQRKSSMFFTADEQRLLQTARRQARSSHNSNVAILGRLKLNATVYIDRQHWAVWLNGRRVTPGERLPFLTIHNVHKDQVHCTWHTNGQHYDVKLSPGQTFYAE